MAQARSEHIRTPTRYTEEDTGRAEEADQRTTKIDRGAPV